MVKKLYKHEALALLRWLIPIDSACLIIALLSRLSYYLDDSMKAAGFLQGMLIFFYILSIFALFIAGYIVIITRFYKHLFTGEGYMTFTLPIKASTHIHCKLTCGIISMITSFLVMLASLGILGAGTDIISIFFHRVRLFCDYIFDNFATGEIILYIVEIIIAVLAAISLSLNMPYAAMSMGQKSKKNRVMSSILWYLVFYTIMQTINAVIMVFGVTINLSITNNLTEFISNNSVHFIIIGYIIYSLVWNGIFYYITRHNLTHKLNLE